MNNVEKVIAIATNEIGYLEKKSNGSLDSKTANAGKNNYTKYWRDLAKGMQSNAWCNCFVNWCFTQAYGEANAKKLLCTSGAWSYYTPTSASYFKNKKQWYTSSPKVGDIIYFKNSTRIHHVGIVYKVDSKNVYTIEGNTSGGSSVVANGGGVFAKQYALSNKNIAGYGRPKYDIVQTPSQTVVTAPTSYSVGKTYKLYYDSYVWSKPTVSSATISLAKYANLPNVSGNILKASSTATCEGVVKEGNNIWLKCPLGYLPAYYNGRYNIK